MDKRLRIYTKKNLKAGLLGEIFKNLSITSWLIIINILFFIISSLLMSIFGSEKIIYWIALQANSFFSGIFWTLLTSMFMHGGLSHLFANMFSLFFIGSFVEKLIGRKRFFWLYILSGIFSGLFFVFLSYFFGNTYFGVKIFGAPDIFAVGASGAIFALGGLLAVLTPKLKVYVFFVIPMQMWIAMIALLFVLWAASIGIGLPFGNTAHLGGLLIGLSYAFYLKKKYKQKTALISRYFSR